MAGSHFVCAPLAQTYRHIFLVSAHTSLAVINMALTGFVDDYPSDYEMVDARPEVESDRRDGSVEEEDTINNLNASNLEEHDKNTGGGGGTRECEIRSNEDGGSEAKTQVGAGLLFGLSGLILGGPIFGILTGVGAAIVASKDEGTAGDVARSTGAFAVTTGSLVGEAARDVNEKHGILEKIKNAFASGWSRVQQFDEEHKVGEKAKETIDDVKQKTVEFEKEHHLMQHILEGVQNGVNFLLDKLKGATTDCDGHTGAGSK